MASLKSTVPLSTKAAVLLLLIIALVAQTHVSVAQNTCSASLGSLNQCAPFVVPGNPNTVPSADCCGALAAVPSDCLCTTLSIASRLPTQCNLPALNCPN